MECARQESVAITRDVIDRLLATKTSSTDAGESVLVVGRPVDALRAWLAFSKIGAGPVFRRIDKWGNIGATALDPQSVNAMIKSRCLMAGLNPEEFSAHGLRSGYLTEATRAAVGASLGPAGRSVL